MIFDADEEPGRQAFVYTALLPLNYGGSIQGGIVVFRDPSGALFFVGMAPVGFSDAG